mgnify:CR=1 FL=1
MHRTSFSSEPTEDPPGTTITCGPNTEEVDGKCVSTVDEAPCAEGASRNPDSGQCEPDVDCGQMGVTGCQPVAVVDLDEIAVSAGGPGRHDLAGARRIAAAIAVIAAAATGPTSPWWRSSTRVSSSATGV